MQTEQNLEISGKKKTANPHAEPDLRISKGRSQTTKI